MYNEIGVSFTFIEKLKIVVFVLLAYEYCVVQQNYKPLPLFCHCWRCQ